MRSCCGVSRVGGDEIFLVYPGSGVDGVVAVLHRNKTEYGTIQYMNT